MSDTTCFTVNVANLPVPAGYESGYVCTNSEYVAGNGDVFYFGGTFDLHYDSWLGCDSIVRLTLQQKVSDFDITVKEVCPGECVVWAGETYCDSGSYDDVQQNQFGCDSINQLLLIVVPLETKINGAANLDCNHPSVTLNSTGSIFSANAVFTWRKNNIVVGTGPTLTVTTGGTYTLSIASLVGDHTCTETASVTIIQNTTPPQGVTAVGGIVNCYNGSVTLLGNSSTPSVTYAWTGPSGFTSNLQNPVANIPGNYTLTVTGTNGCTKTATTSVTENKVQPTAVANVNGTLNCNAATVQLNGSGSSTGGLYTYNWTTSNGNITMDGNTLAPTVNQGGTYLLTVTNTNNGCTNTASVTVVKRPIVAAQINNQTNVTCFGENNGSATASATGGDGSFSYSWSTGSSAATISNLTAGTYTVVVTDGDGCTASQSVTIAQPANLLPNATTTPQTAFGVNDGTATANPTGGTSGYTYLWGNSQTTQTITDLAPGNYTVVVTDANGCSASQTVTVSEVACAITTNIDQTNVSCPGAADGAATAILVNAAEPITYAWSNGENTQTITGLSGGTYDVSATDAAGCDIVITVNIDEPLAFNSNANSTNLTAFNANDGTASANPNGGTAPYTYAWSNGETTASITNLVPGSYTVVVTDANDCETQQTVIVNQFNCTVSATIILGQISCNGESDGQATFSLLGGSSPFTYEWSTGETTSTIIGLSAGTYTGTATDAAGCPAIAQATLTNPDVVGFDLVEMVEALCGANDGSLTVTGTGGSPGYTYLWTTGGEITPTISGLVAGTYGLEITDANGCTNSFDIVLGTPDITPPTLNCPGNLLINNCSEVVDLMVTTTDNCGDNVNLVQTAGLPSGSNFPLGNTDVSFTATDLSGNTSTCSFVVTVQSNITLTVSQIDVTCFGENDGSATANPVGGLAPITYHWSNNDDTQTTTGLVAGTYTVTTTDAGGCTASQSVTIGQPTNLTTTLVALVNSVTGLSNGTIDVTVAGGTQPYTFVWKDPSGAVIGTTEDIGGLAPATYTLVATDAHGCQTQSAYTIQNMDATTESALDSHVLLYPNPTLGEVTLELVDLVNYGSLEVTAFDITGREVLHSTNPNSKQMLDFKAKPGGVYVLKIVIGDDVLTKRLVVNK